MLFFFKNLLQLLNISIHLGILIVWKLSQIFQKNWRNVIFFEIIFKHWMNAIKDITVKIHPVFKKNLVSLFFSRRRGRASKDLLHCEDYHTSQNQGSTELNWIARSSVILSMQYNTIHQTSLDWKYLSSTRRVQEDHIRMNIAPNSNNHPR